MGAYNHSLLDGEATPAPTFHQSQQLQLALKSMLKDRQSRPSHELLHLFQSCNSNPKEAIEQYVNKLGQSFISSFTEQHEDTPAGSNEEFASMILPLALSLFYYQLEVTLMNEKQKKGNDGIPALLENTNYQKALFACCLEVVLFSYNMHRQFPWILKVLELEPYYFHKVIEVIVINVYEKLPKETILHLKSIEEQILDSLVWHSESPVWREINAMKAEGKMLPTYEEVKLQGNESKSLTSPSEQNIQGSKVTGALQIFLRKFNILASKRLKSLCSKLNLTDADIKKIWTTLEYSIIHDTQLLLMDRHLDQLVMCAIYVVCKATKQNLAFQTIIHHYRTLPFSASHVHRNVLLSRAAQEKRENTTDVEKELMEDKRGDVISFYDTVYVKCVQKFVLETFSNCLNPNALFMSPVPAPKIVPIESPKIRVPQSPNLLISNLNKKRVTDSPGRSMTFFFKSSPVQTLHQINSMVNSVNPMGARKKLIMEDSDITIQGPSPPKKFKTDSLVQLKVKDLIEDRVNFKE